MCVINYNSVSGWDEWGQSNQELKEYFSGVLRDVQTKYSDFTKLISTLGQTFKVSNNLSGAVHKSRDMV